jgi:hypothetical protein
MFQADSGDSGWGTAHAETGQMVGFAAARLPARRTPIGEDLLLALALLLTTATQFRPPGTPVGPGEILLIIWIGLAAGREVVRLGPPLTPALSRLLIFWVLFLLAQLVGTLTGYIINDAHDPVLFLHDAMAYPLVAIFSCLTVTEPGAAARLRRVVWFMVALGALTVQLVIAWGWLDVSIMEPWFGDRFRGWSHNPNQLGFLCAMLVLLAMHLADSTDRSGARIFALACAIPALWVGGLTKTDTVTFALLAASPVYAGIKLRSWMATGQRKLTARSAAALIAVLAVPMMLISAIPYAISWIGDPQALAAGLTKNGGKEAAREADLRLELWGEAISRGMDAALLGLGPGPHLPIPASIIAARLSDPELDTGDHPVVNGLPNFEAHNTVLDLFTQAGLLGVLSLVWIMAAALIASFRARQAGLAAMACGLMVFGLTNLIVRPPLFWLGLAICLVQRDAGAISPSPSIARAKEGVRAQ